MNLTLISLLILAIFFIGVGVFHRFARRNSAGLTPKIGVFTIAAALFVVVGSGEYGISIDQIQNYGWAGLSFLFGLVVAFLFISRFTEKIIEIRDSSESIYSLDGYINYSTPDFLYSLYGKYASLIASVIVSLCFFGLYILQVYVGGVLLSAAADISVTVASILIAITVIAYAVAGGFYSLFRTDSFQALLMLVSLTVATVYSMSAHSDIFDVGQAFSALNEKSLEALSITNLSQDPTVISVFALTVCAAFAGADIWQRINIADNASSAKLSLYQGAAALLIFSGVIYLFAGDAISALNYAGVDIDDPFVNYIQLSTDGAAGVSPWPELVTAIFSVGLLAAFVSTADTCLLLCVSSAQNEFHRWTGAAAKPHHGMYLLHSKILYPTVAIVGLIGLGLSLYQPNLVEQFLIVLGALGVLGIPVLATLLGFGSRNLVITSLLFGAIITICIGYIFPGVNTGFGILLPCIPGLLCFLKRRK